MDELVEVVGTPYLYSGSANEQVAVLADRVVEMRSMGKLSRDALERIRKYFRIKNIYHSNAIEGNVLDVGETREVVEMGLTLTGKPLKDQAEAKNLAGALDYLEHLATKVDQPITEMDVRQLHGFVLKGINDENAGKYRSAPVEISGSAYKPPGPESVPLQMAEFGDWLQLASSPDQGSANDPLILAVAAHTWFVTIHPFIDGNGRVARLLMNLILMRHGYPLAIITREDRQRYYDALEESQSCDLTPFVALVAESLEESLEEYEAAVKAQRDQQEWAKSIASQFTQGERVRAQNEYEVWRAAMELLKSYFRQTAELLDETASFGNVYFKDFGTLEFEKYASLAQGESAKRTWFFRIDFRSGSKTARYLLFFGAPSFSIRDRCEVTAHVAREESPFNFVRLEHLTAPNVPDLLEIGYVPKEERFLARYRGSTKLVGVEEMGRHFITQITNMHFGSR